MDKRLNKIELLQNENWKFHLGEEPDAWRKDYDDTSWTEVILPHDWSVRKDFSKNYSSGMGYTTGGIAWYRHTFFLPEEYKGKNVQILFDGIYKNGSIWCNSYYKGYRPYGYATFGIDITEEVRFGEINEISVRVDHSEMADSRWFTGSGITRKVSLILQEPVYTVHDGVFFWTKDADPEKADIGIQNEICNNTGSEFLVKVRNRLFDTAGIEALCVEREIRIPGRSTRKVCQEGRIYSPDLWSDVTPALYSLVTELSVFSQAGTQGQWYVTDQRHVGIRKAEFDPDRGFFINGRHTKLKGVCLHHDAGCLGAAVTKEIWYRRLKKLKNAGCNGIRMSHNPHMPELYELCDEMGFFVIDEAFDEWEGAKNKWTKGHNVYPPVHEGYYKDFPLWQEKDLKGMVRRDRSHPCVVLWSVGNEVDYPNDPYCHPLFTTMTGNNDANKPAAEKEYNPDKPNAERLTAIINMLIKEVKEEDDTRPATVAAAFPELTTQLGFIDNLQVVGYNYKEDLYQSHHKQFPDKVFLGSETDHSRKAWEAVKKNAYISGQFLWTGIDYMGETLGWPLRGSESGLLDMAGYEKPEYYRRRAMWCENPVIQLMTLRAGMGEEIAKGCCLSWNYQVGELIEVRCYTNMEKVSLALNGKNLGEGQEGKDCIIWNVPFEPGILKASSPAYETTSVLRTSGSPVAIQLSMYDEGEEIPENPFRIYQIEVTLTDRDGNLAETAENMLYVSVEKGTLLGIENGNLRDVTEYTAPYRRAFHGKAIIYIRKKKDEIPACLHVKGEYLKDQELYLK